MPTDLIRYDLLVQEALKGVVRRILIDAARDGLPGEHHFYVSFRTDHAGVRLSPRLRERYPQDMTIVLQHQFDDLNVMDVAFEVGLSFSGIAERLRVPFDALTGFFDPSVQFGLKFELNADEAAEKEPDAPPSEPIPIKAPRGGLPAPKTVPKSGPRKLEEAGKAPSEARGATKKAGDPDGDEPNVPGAGAEVVSLDSFRKKS